MKSCAPTVCAAAHDLLRRRVGPAELDVVGHRAGKEEALLRDDAELTAQRGLRHVAEIDRRRS